jgi:SAM-dependent methyltransferase
MPSLFEKVETASREHDGTRWGGKQMPLERCDSESRSFVLAMQRKLERFYDRLKPFCVTTLGSTACLEFPVDYLETLNSHNEATIRCKEWAEIYKNLGDGKPEYDLWLDKYESILQDANDLPIIDLGCGYGNDTLYLHERGYRVVSCDLSAEALKRLTYFIAEPVTKQFDMLNGLPFAKDSAKIIIADLSLHYFYWEDTKSVLNDIRRVLVNGGHLLCRVNSIRDTNHGAGQGRRIEKNYFEVQGRLKRFFNRECIEDLFKDWSIEHINEVPLYRYGKEKILWEVAVKKAS